MKWALLSILCLLAIVVARADTDYTATVPASSVQLGQPVTVSWTGSCSHSDWTGCYDWIAPFQAQACADGPGRNTCYLNKQWSWVSDDDGSWSVSFEGPGDYEFRFPYCGCGKCEPILDDFAQCAEYDSYGTSPVVRVDPPFNLTKFSPGDQYLLGILWVLFEGSMADIDTLLSKPGSGACTTCFCEVRSLVSQASKFGDDFDVMVNGSYSSLFDQMKTVVSDLATMVQTISDSITECHIDDILGKAVSKDLTASTLRLVSGLEAATEFFKIIVAAENVYTEVSNVRMAWHLKNYFTSGVFTGRVIETILSAVSGRAVAASDSATASVQHQCVLRHPGGHWSPCNCSEPLDLARFPGNRCKPLSYYSALPPL